MAVSSLDLSDRAELRVLADPVAAIRAASPHVRFVLVGAMARDLLLTWAHGIPARRATEDLDFAFAVADWPAFAQLRDALLANGDFVEVPRVPHRLLFAGERRVDLIPFGGVERPQGMIDWPAPQSTRMVVLGFREAMRSAIRVALPNDVSVDVASLPAQSLLKLFAWGDRRHDVPGKDAGDLWLLLGSYLEAGNRERLYVEAAHLFEAVDYDDDLAGAWMLGTDARQLLGACDATGDAALKRALALLAGCSPDGPVRLARDMHTVNLDHAMSVLVAFRAGLAGHRDFSGGQ